MTQDSFAAACGMKKRSQVTYESGERCPDAIYLELAERVGADTTYIVTGKRRQGFASSEGFLDLDVLEAAFANLSILEDASSPSWLWGHLSPKKKAHFVAMLYRSIKANGKIDIDLIQQAMRLASDM